MQLTYDQISEIWNRTDDEKNLILIESAIDDDIGNIKVIVSNIENNMDTEIFFLDMYGAEIKEVDYVK